VSRITTNGITLHVLDEGVGSPVLLLHGFPDSARLWRHQIGALVGAGRRVVAPDLRGFGESDRPTEVAAYRLSTVLADLMGLLDALGLDRVAVVGHDWGAGVAWLFAALHPERVERLAVLSVGHPAVRPPSLAQREKAWYMLLFQFEGVAEELLRRDDWSLLREWLRGNGDLDSYLADLARPGALTAALNWYRANVHPRGQLTDRPPPPAVAAPTLGLWSSGDDYLLEEGMLASGRHVTGPWRYQRIEDASHWMQLDAPERVNELLVDFLAEPA